MKKPDPINKVHHNDEFSSGLMEQYGQWMGGDCFQNTEMPDIHLSEAPFDGMDPQSNGAEIEDTTKKKKSAKKESPKKQLDIPGAAKEEVEVLDREEYEVDGVKYVLERTKDGWKAFKEHHQKDADGKVIEHEEEELKEYFEKNKDGKMVKKHNCAKKVKKEGLEYDVVSGEHTMLEDGTVTHYDLVSENGDVLKNVPVEGLEILISEVHEHADNHAKNSELLGEKKLDPVGKSDGDVDNDGDKDKSDKYLLAKRKKVSKILGMKKK